MLKQILCIAAAVGLGWGLGSIQPRAEALTEPVKSYDPAKNYKVKLTTGEEVLCERARTDNGGTLFVLTKDSRRLAFSPSGWLSFETVDSN